MKKTVLKVLVTMLMVVFATTSVFAASYNLVEEHPYTPEGAWSYAVAESIDARVMAVFLERDWGDFWGIHENDYVGLGFSDSIDERMEWNVNGDNAMAYMAFVAPADGTYEIDPIVIDVHWDQAGGSFFVEYPGDTEEFVIGNDGVTTDSITVELEEGDWVYFWATSGGGWYSAYVGDIFITNTDTSAEYSAIDDFDTENADGSVVPWVYLYSTVNDFDFHPMTELLVEAWYDGNQFGYFYWTTDDFWTNAGVSFSAENRIELNSDGGNISSAAVFTTPETETYNLSIALDNLWNANAGTLYIFKNGSLMETVDLSDVDKDNPLAYEDELDLVEGDELIFFATAASGWFSSYVDITLEVPVDEEPVDEEPVDEEPVDEEPVDEDELEEEPGDVLPIVAVLASAITAAGALVLKKRK